MGLGGRETEMEEAGLTAGCAHKPPLPFKPKARPCVGNQHESIKMKEHGGGARQRWAGGPHRQKRDNNHNMEGCTETEQNRTEQNQNSLSF